MNEKQVDNILKDYQWLLNSIRLYRQDLASAGDNITQQYENADMPKAQSTSDPVYSEVLRREKRRKKIKQFEVKVLYIQDRQKLVKDQRHQEVLHWILEGKSLGWIGRHMGLSATHIHRLKNEIVKGLSE